MKHNKGVKLTAILLSAALMTSCSFIVWNDPDAEVTTADTTDDETTEPTTTPPETKPPLETEVPRDFYAEASERIDGLPVRDLSQANVLIASFDDSTVAPTIDIEGESLPETLTARKLAAQMVEEKYGTHLIMNVIPTDDILSAAKEAFAADMYYADLLVLPVNKVGEFSAAGILANMYSLPFADYSKPYYSADFISEAQLGNELRAVSGAANFSPDNLSCIYFDRDAAKNLGLGDIYELVNSGKWTYDKLLEFTATANASAGVNGFASAFSRDEFINIAAESMNVDFVTNAPGQLPTLDYKKDGALWGLAEGIVEQLYELLYDKSGKTDMSLSDFTSGGQLFYHDTLGAIPSLADAKVRWGLLPMPKHSESQSNYITPMSDTAPVFCAISNTPDYDKPGLTLEALNSTSYDFILETYKSEVIDYCLRDSGSIAMLNLISSATSTDFVNLFSSGINGLETATLAAIRRAVTTSASLTTAYNSSFSTAEKSLSSSVLIH